MTSRRPAPGAESERSPQQESAVQLEAEPPDEDEDAYYSSEPPPLDSEKIGRFTMAGKQPITSLIEERYLRP